MSQQSTLQNFLRHDLLASVVVFLVALPLCMGIAIASGAPPALGLMSGIIGGLVVAPLAGSPLQVSGPAAGLAVIVWELIEKYGLETLGLVVLMGGIIQILASVGKAGRWFRAVPPAVIRGMLAGIGVLIFASQFHVMVDDAPRSNGVENLLSIPESLWKGLVPMDGNSHHLAALVGVVTIISIVGWNRVRKHLGPISAVPGALMGVVIGTLLASLLNMPIQFVDIPDDLFSSLTLPGPAAFSTINADMVFAAIGLAVVASAESLLSATAVDRLHQGERTNYDKELMAQGAGNLVAGLVGALPITGVIVRSSANVEAGAQTRWSAIIHGLWLLGLIALAPFVLELIPRSSLAAILVYTGWKLMNPAAMTELARHGRSEVFIFLATVAGVVGTDLLTGIMIGLGLAMLRLLIQLATVRVDVQDNPDGSLNVTIDGVASFPSLPRIAAILESVPEGVPVHLDTGRLHYVDSACVELVENWARQHVDRGAVVNLDEQRFQTGNAGGGH